MVNGSEQGHGHEQGVNQAKGSVIWAIDPFEKEVMPERQDLKHMTSMMRSAGLVLRPVHIIAAPKESVEDYLEDSWITKYKQATEKAAEKYIAEAGVVGARATEVITSRSPFRKNDIRELIQYADQQKSEFIIVSSHGRTGLDRFVMGSFAESVLANSDRPIFFLRHSESKLQEPVAETASASKKAVFATDFSKYSKQAYKRFLDFAHKFNFEVILFHCVTIPASAVAQAYGSPLPIPDNYFSDQVESAEQDAKEWQEAAKAVGVKSSVVVRDGGIGANVANQIMLVASEIDAQMIAMASVSGPVATVLAGSVARDVFRHNRFPVWVYGPKVTAY